MVRVGNLKKMFDKLAEVVIIASYLGLRVS